MKKRIIVMLSLLCVCASNAAGKKPHTFLKKAVYYAGAQTKDIKIENIDLGRVVLLFSDKKVAANKKVVMSLVPFSKKDSESKIATKKDVFVFPYSDFENTEIRKKAKTFSAIKNNYYALDLKKGANGLKLTIEYNPSIVSFERTRFSNINLQKGVEFRFYNKRLLETVKNRLGTSMRVSSLKKKNDHC